jgi:hypothetical protein
MKLELNRRNTHFSTNNRRSVAYSRCNTESTITSSIMTLLFEHELKTLIINVIQLNACGTSGPDLVASAT